MAKLTKDLLICKPGDVYPTQLRAGDECPAYALQTADQLKILEKVSRKKPVPENKALKGAPENKGGKK
ncbi:hypothetical protein [Paracoccus sp. (in: a-proteobacteria)]|uniref:hypothetical protein n=1 Tax=Paracoccus sp. TaxID=267 RepID=UPI0040587543